VPAADETHTPTNDPTYERFFELSDDLLCVADLRGFFVRVNTAFERVLGYPMKDLLRDPFLTYVHPDDHPATHDAMDKLNRGEKLAEFRNRYRTARGEYRWLEWTARTVPAEQLIFAVARDVTERLDLLQKLQLREERERAILDHTAALVYVKGLDGRYEFVNTQWEKVCNWPRELVIGRTDAELFPLEFAAKFVAIDRQVLETGEPFQGEEEAPTTEGTRTYVSVKVPLRDATGRVVALAGVSTDITDRTRADAAEAELRTARQLQQRLYPRVAPTLPGFDIAGRGRSASTLCGDYFDFIPRANGRLVLAVGDVCGHGLGPALTMVETRATLRLTLAGGGTVSDAARVVNAQLNCAAGDSLFVTLFLAEIDPADRILRWAGAGHDGRLYRADGNRLKLASTGMPLGVVDPIELEPELSERLLPGDALVLFTDGLTEAMNPSGEQFGTDRLRAAVEATADRPAAEIVEGVFAAVSAHLTGLPPLDDMTIVVVKVK
jgi:sigma-B regulation protein RsbU (phosphoserine phosphatase)